LNRAVSCTWARPKIKNQPKTDDFDMNEANERRKWCIHPSATAGAAARSDWDCFVLQNEEDVEQNFERNKLPYPEIIKKYKTRAAMRKKHQNAQRAKEREQNEKVPAAFASSANDGISALPRRPMLLY